MTTDRQPVLPDDLDRFADVGEVVLSRDGARVAAAVSRPDVRTNRYHRDVVTGPVDGDAPLAPLDPGGSVRLPRWSPADDRLAVVVDGPAGCEVRVVAPDGSMTTVVAGWPDPVEELAWSPDGRRLLFVAREPLDRGWYELPEDRRPPRRLTTLGYREDGIGWTVDRPRQAHLVDADGTAAPARLSTGGFDDAEFAWHPDGRSVYFVGKRHPGADRSIANDVFVQPLDGEPRRLTRSDLLHSSPVPSPDGSLVALTVTDVAGFPAAQHLAVLDPATGTLTDLAAGFDRDCAGGSIGWTDEGGVAVVVEDAGAIAVHRFSTTEPGAHQVLVGGQRRVTAFDVRGGRTAVVTSGPVDPPAVSVIGADGAERVRHAPSAATRRSLVAPRYEAVPVAPGVTVDSWLVRPDRPGPLPVVVWLQGGGTQYGWQFSHELQVLVSAGYAVLYLNPRGSAGYGTAWMRTVSGPRAAVPGSGWGVTDVADVVAVVRATLDSSPDLDPARVGVMGGSYGGLLTAHLLAQTDLFRAGWAERGPYDLYSDAGTKDEAPWFFEAYLGASHLDDAASYWQASPIRLVRDITAPLAIVHSEEDRRCSIGQAEELFMALKLLDREVELIRFPGEGHELTRSGSPVHRLQRLEILLEWFGRWLRP
ncbi:S9 family peptidase [Modestobacter versicolor]|uniref:Dipeptidyl aminopeptidase/acylaminoacyl peptidase n=1 Tax=Modestobacter versicolor TaxID=429133 RepID=A0A839Y6G7_9ACTN|nr:S9 family peptidase [Modestobacter versicolor]MBB3678325.1 dipeptidyl aminopeptidase/acylaminoacyl peptidase [Modestobacter versicolor]